MSSPLRAAEPVAGRHPSEPDRPLLVLLPLLLSGLAFAGITLNYFLADDFFNLLDLVNDGWWRFVWQVAYGHLLPVRNAAFALHYVLFGLEPAGYFATVLANHLLNVLLLFALIRRWTGSSEVACAGATLWGTTPTSAGALGWYSVYGQVIAASMLLALLLSLPGGPPRREPATPGRIALWAILLLAGAASFGTGLGVAVVFPAVALLVCPLARRRPAGPLTLCAITLAIGLVYAAVWAAGDPSAADQQFERRLTQVGFPELLSRVGATVHFVAAGSTTLLLGDLHALSPRPGALEYLILGLLGTVTAWALRRGGNVERPRLLAAFLVTLSCYGAIALGRSHGVQLLGLSASMLRLVAHYHYMALVGITLWICLLVTALWVSSRTRRWGLAALVVANVASSWIAGSPIDHHQQARIATEKVVDDLVRQIIAQPPGATLCLPNRPFFPTRHLGFPGEVGVFLIYLNGRPAIRDRHVFFTEKPWLGRVEPRAGSPISRLLVDPDRCPPQPTLDATVPYL